MASGRCGTRFPCHAADQELAGLLCEWSWTIVLGRAGCNGRRADSIDKVKALQSTKSGVGSSNLAWRAHLSKCLPITSGAWPTPASEALDLTGCAAGGCVGTRMRWCAGRPPERCSPAVSERSECTGISGAKPLQQILGELAVLLDTRCGGRGRASCRLGNMRASSRMRLNVRRTRQRSSWLEPSESGWARSFSRTERVPCAHRGLPHRSRSTVERARTFPVTGQMRQRRSTAAAALVPFPGTAATQPGRPRSPRLDTRQVRVRSRLCG